MNPKTYPLFKVHIPKDEALARISEVFDSGFINEGTQVTELTRKLSTYLDAPNLVLTNSCTSALVMALKLAGCGVCEDVISTPMTCVATNAAIAQVGSKIVWADVLPTHGMLTAQTIEAAINPITRAVVVVAWAGTPPDLEGIRKVCDKHGLALILDAAHAFDARYKGKPVHAWADFTCYSFQAIKHFTTGDGGALVSTRPEDFKRSKAMKWFGLDRDKTKDAQGNWKGQQWDTDIEEIGYKFNMNNVSAAIGLSQMRHIDDIMRAHRYHAFVYDDLFKDCQTVVPNSRPEGAEPSHWVYAMQVTMSSKIGRDDLLKVLNAEGIMAGVVHAPNDDYTCFKQIKVDLPGVRDFGAYQFSLPCGWWLEDADVRHIAKRVKELTV